MAEHPVLPVTLTWVDLIRTDVRRYTEYSRGSSPYQVMLQQGLWATTVYRFSHAVLEGRLPRPIRRAVLAPCGLLQKIVEIVTGISLPVGVSIGPGLYIGHFGNIIVSPDAVIGANCNLSQGVTIGVSGYGPSRGAPHLSDEVYVGPNAVVVGKILVGRGAVIAANSLVVKDVPEMHTAIGVPATTKPGGSRHFIHPETDQ